MLIRTEGECIPNDGVFLIKQIIEKNKVVQANIVVRQNDENGVSSCIVYTNIDSLENVESESLNLNSVFLCLKKYV